MPSTKPPQNIQNKSKIGRMILKAAVMGFSIFIILAIISVFLKIAPIHIILIGSALCALFTSGLYLIRLLLEQK